ncbi:hypothetical protein SLEP1_g17207 [Rubroshorea leprosula]|uniref:Uncharacterized protein n=1 Tax=Rubroshorea leprosula TaxID=152421 RepID=A0AAV5J2Q3_9ROSI|nr:hypothetical protein SLEP1_g17207 [Rubroshorea leprosula]
MKGRENVWDEEVLRFKFKGSRVRDQDCYSAIKQNCTKGQKPETEDAADAPLKVPAPCEECRPLAQ